ncbi:serine carboxypeptidase-like 50 [Hordeum vulgare]|nr:serine carboxypeptidase-like 50 [Hordeum vulgare]
MVVAFSKDALPTSSGYLPVNMSTSTSLFFAIYEASAPLAAPADTLLLHWLKGGPGCSGLPNNFLQLGPYFLGHRSGNSASLSRNPFAWNRRFRPLFLDSPLGTDFSVASSTTDIPRSHPAIVEHVLAALQSFFDAVPADFRVRPFFLASESHAGKYVPAAASHILVANMVLPAHRRISLCGVAIGNGLVHPVMQVATYADTAYFMGLVNGRQRLELEVLRAEGGDARWYRGKVERVM